MHSPWFKGLTNAYYYGFTNLGEIWSQKLKSEILLWWLSGNKRRIRAQSVIASHEVWFSLNIFDLPFKQTKWIRHK
jgi:hypothetical protein